MLNFDGDTNVDVKSEQALSANGPLRIQNVKKLKKLTESIFKQQVSKKKNFMLEKECESSYNNSKY